jgi:hypothetical protein
MREKGERKTEEGGGKRRREGRAKTYLQQFFHLRADLDDANSK